MINSLEKVTDKSIVKNLAMEAITMIKTCINGMEYRSSIGPAVIDLAKRNGIVIMYGQSDDLMEVEGFINDEVYAYDGLNYQDDFDLGNFPEDVFNLMQDHEIELIWCPDDRKSWSFKLSEKSIFKRFNIFEDWEVFSEGIILLVEKQLGEVK